MYGSIELGLSRLHVHTSMYEPDLQATCKRNRLAIGGGVAWRNNADCGLDASWLMLSNSLGEFHTCAAGQWTQNACQASRAVFKYVCGNYPRGCIIIASKAV